RQPGLNATNGRAELAIRFGVLLRKVWGGSRTWAGAWAQSVLRSVWRTCWQQGRSALDSLGQLLRGTPVALALPPGPTAHAPMHSNDTGTVIYPRMRCPNGGRQGLCAQLIRVGAVCRKNPVWRYPSGRLPPGEKMGSRGGARPRPPPRAGPDARAAPGSLPAATPT